MQLEYVTTALAVSVSAVFAAGFGRDLGTLPSGAVLVGFVFLPALVMMRYWNQCGSMSDSVQEVLR